MNSYKYKRRPNFIPYGSCNSCEYNGTLNEEDLSFDHAFGTEHASRPICPECESEDVDVVDWLEKDWDF